MKSKWVTHGGKRIFHCDYSGFGNDVQGLIREVNAADSVAGDEPNDSILCLVDVRDTVISSEVVDCFKQSSAKTQAQIRKMAIIGVTGVRKVMYKAVMRFSGQKNSALFNDVASAKAWLVED